MMKVNRKLRQRAFRTDGRRPVTLIDDVGD
jgi:hypothetical protein